MKTLKTERWIAWILFGISMLAFTGNLVLEVMGCGMLINLSQPDPASAFGLLMLPLNALSVSFLGALIIHYHPGNRIGWVCILYGLGFPIGLLGESYGTCSIMNQLNLPGEIQALWLFHFADFTTIGLVLFFWLFPDGQFHSKRWRKIGLIFLSLVILFDLLDYFWPGSIGEFLLLKDQVDNPFALNIHPLPFWTNFIDQGKQIAGLVFALLGILTLILRWRKSIGVVRQQIKWMAFFLMTSGTLFLTVELVGVTVYPEIFEGWFYLIELAVFWLGFPIVLGLAIFKYRLYDIDFIIRRTLQYSLLTGLLVLVYFGLVILLQNVVSTFNNQQSPVIIVISTLVIAALFNPLRVRTQNFIDRRFYREKYNAQKTLAKFSEALRDEVDMDTLTDRLVSVIDESLQPEGVSLWIKK